MRWSGGGRLSTRRRCLPHRLRAKRCPCTSGAAVRVSGRQIALMQRGVLIKMSVERRGVIGPDERRDSLTRARCCAPPNTRAPDLPPEHSCFPVCARLGADHCCRVILGSLGSHGSCSQDNGIGKLSIERGCGSSGRPCCAAPAAPAGRPGDPSALLSRLKRRYSLYHLFSRSTRSRGAIQSEF